MKPKLKTLLKQKDYPEFKKTVTQSSLFTLFLCIMPFLIALVGSLFNLEQYNEFYGCVYLIYCAITIFIIYKMDKKYVLDNERQISPMKPLTFFRCFSSLISLMLICTVPTVIIDTILSNYGYSIVEVASANTLSDSVTDFIYVSFIGPICEEIIFRGWIQKRLYKFTPFIAIFTSSVMFGIYHGNFGQMFQAMGVGVVLGYVAYRYSIKWSMAIHISYNFLLGELSGFISELLSKNGEEFVIPGTDFTPFTLAVAVFAAIGFIFLFIQYFFKKNFLQKYNVKFKKLIIPLTSVGFIIYTIYNIITSILLIEPI